MHVSNEYADSSRSRAPWRSEVIQSELAYTAPFDGEGLIGFLGRRAVPGVEEVTEGVYRRSMRLASGPGVIELSPADGHVQARFRLESRGDLSAATARSRALLDLDADPHAVLAALGGDPLLGPLIEAAPGRRVPGHVDAHELAVRAILGQQVSLKASITLAGRLVAAYGEPLARPIGSVTHLFPSVERLAEAAPEELAMPAARRRALLGLSGALARGELVLDPGANRERTRRQMLALPGIGPWTVAYVEMRALRDPDAFLPSDLGVRRALERLGHDGRPGAAAKLAQRWRPYRAYALAHLWAAL